MTGQVSSVVLGAGLMGRLLAYKLAQLGHAVVVYEAQGSNAEGAAARVAAAMLAPLAESAITELAVVRMGHYGLTRWPALIDTLPAPVFFQQNGTLVLWHRQDAAEAKRFSLMLARSQQQLPCLQPVQLLDSASVRAHEVGCGGMTSSQRPLASTTA